MSYANWLFVAAPAALFWVFVLAEYATRWWLRAKDKYYVWTPHYRHISELDPSGFPNFPSPARVFINSEGERGNEVPRNAKKIYRVLVAGGSAPECFVLDQEAAWPMVL